MFLHKNNDLKWTIKNNLIILKKVFLEDWQKHINEKFKDFYNCLEINEFLKCLLTVY